MTQAQRRLLFRIAAERGVATEDIAKWLETCAGLKDIRRWSKICLALALWALARQPTTVVPTRVCAWPGRDTTSWRTLTRWASAVASGSWPWCRAATELGARAAARSRPSIASARPAQR